MDNKDENMQVSRNDGNTLLCDVYSSLLRLYQGGDNAFCEWQEKPFVIGENVYATDAKCILFFDKEKVEYVPPLSGYEPNNILRLIPEERPFVALPLSQIEKAFEKSNAMGKEQCDACLGEGIVSYSFYYEKDKDYYEKLHVCPICEGVGYFDKKDKVYFDIKGFRFSGQTIYKLIVTASKLKQDTIYLAYSGSSTLFKIGDVSVVAAPCQKESKDDEAVFSHIA